MTDAKKLAEKYMSDWYHSRFAYSKDYTPESAFLAGYEAAQERVRELEDALSVSEGLRETIEARVFRLQEKLSRCKCQPYNLIKARIDGKHK
ncbi:MAG: hypothetical protein NVS3B3_05980 [Aquirhabdus sp.]